MFLMPPSLREWLPVDHLAWFVLDVVGEFDLTGFYERYRPDGRGGAAYEPATMIGLFVYSYCVGDRSSRLIERRCVEDVAYRVIAANQQPDHATIARFRAEHEDALAGLFAQVLAMCAAAGMVRVGLVAIDGTKVEACASKATNMTGEQLQKALAAEARRIIAEAKAIDAAEDELYGDERGDELPPELADRESRLARLREAKAHLEAEQAAREQRPTPKTKNKPVRVNVTDPDSGLMKTVGGFCQGYNAQAAATADQVIVAAELSNRGVDVEWFAAMVAATEANIASAGVTEAVGTFVADAGYYSTDNATLDTPADVLIATAKTRDLPVAAPEPLGDVPAGGTAAGRQAFHAAEIERAERVAAIFDRTNTGELTLTDAAIEIDVSYTRASQMRTDYRRHGIDALKRKRRPNGFAAHDDGPDPRIVRHEMQTRLATEHGRARYKLRAQTIEPIFGQVKHVRGVRRFQRRGLAACAAEWKLITATHNLLKLWRHGTASRPAII